MNKLHTNFATSSVFCEGILVLASQRPYAIWFHEIISVLWTYDLGSYIQEPGTQANLAWLVLRLYVMNYNNHKIYRLLPGKVLQVSQILYSVILVMTMNVFGVSVNIIKG